MVGTVLLLLLVVRGRTRTGTRGVGTIIVSSLLPPLTLQHQMLLVGMGGAGRAGGMSTTLLRCIVAVVAVMVGLVVVGVGVIGVVVVVSPCGSTAKQFCWGQSIVLIVSSDTCVGRQKRQMSIAVAVGSLWTVPAGMRRPLHVCSTAEIVLENFVSKKGNKQEHKKHKTKEKNRTTAAQHN